MDGISGDVLSIRYIALRDAIQWERNPKKHDISLLVDSIERYGFRDAPIFDGALAAIVAGNGRVSALIEMQEAGKDAPGGIAQDDNGDWYVPIQFGIDAESQVVAEAFGIAHNNITMAGGDFSATEMAAIWDMDGYLTVLESMDTLPPGISEDDLDELKELFDGGGLGDNYSRKIEAPIYEPSGDIPPPESLCDTARTDKLVEDIEAADVPDEVKVFLIHAAQRHTVFDFSKIADFYAHSDADIQRLMEDSALVIIDFNRAIELGFVHLSEKLREQVALDYE